MSTDTPGPVAQQLEAKLAAAFDLKHLEVVNESGGHNVPPGSESHFKVVLVADAFASLTRIARHRAVHAAVAQELEQAIHALAVHAYSPPEWEARFGTAPMSPPCLGGKAGEAAEG